MRALAVFTLFLIGCLLLSAILHYPLFSLLQHIADIPPHKLVTRGGKLLALPGFFLLVVWIGLYSRQALGYGLPKPTFIRQMALGWLVGLAILLLLAGTLITLDVRVFKPLKDSFVQDLIKTLASGLIAGLLVALIEETFFRGAMFQAIRRQGTALSAITLTSLLYAAVHFIDPLPLPKGEPVEWLSGLQILGSAFWQFGEWATFDSFIALFAVGVFLGLVRERHGNIAYCIGLHAGWVLVIKCTKKFSSNAGGEWGFLTGNYDGVTGYLAFAWISLLAISYYLISKGPKETGNPTA
jgi:membrane protease YdiL (CAAX protease family)